jgi:hypothetical protein
MTNAISIKIDKLHESIQTTLPAKLYFPMPHSNKAGRLNQLYQYTINMNLFMLIAQVTFLYDKLLEHCCNFGSMQLHTRHS